MINFATWLFSLVGPIVRKALIALGLGAITYQGVDTAFDKIVLHIVSNFSELSGITANLIALSGFFEAISILLGALTARLSLAVFTKIGSMQ